MGLAGARVDNIAERSGLAKRMIYYHFASKLDLYIAVLRRAYQRTRHGEELVDLISAPPAEAMRKLIEHTFDNHAENEDFVRLVGVEDTQKAAQLSAMPDISALNALIIDKLDGLLKRGQADGVFRRDIEALDLHLVMSSLSFFRVANRHTFGAVFQCDLDAPKLRRRHRALFADMIMNYLTAEDAPIDQGKDFRRRRVSSRHIDATSR